jgi:glycosyltransferase involved in cell wall biosynthesis
VNIWYIHHYGGGPGLGAYDRPYQLARAWEAQGHRATAFIASFHHLLQRPPPLEPEFSIDNARYVSVPARSYSGNGVGRILNLWDFSRNLYATGLAQAHGGKPDAIIASSPHPFAIFPASRLAKRFGASLVFEIRDIWPLSITEILGTSRLHPFVQMCAFAERFALAKSDLIASVLPRADRYLADRGFGHKPFVWVPNGSGSVRDRTELTSEEGRHAAALTESWQREGNVVIAHAGAMGKPNAVDLLVEALAYGRSIGEADKCRLLLVGGGQEEAHLRELVKSSNVAGVHFSGRLPKGDVPALLEHVDIGYGGVRTHDRLYRYGVSLNKFADYYRASLPILLPIAPCGDPVSESGGGIARRAETPEAVWSALRELVILPPQQRRALGEKGRAYMASEYDYAGIAARYVDAIRRVAGRTPAA